MQVITQTAPELYAGSVDDILGDRRERFLGEGFKRVTDVLTDIAVRPAGGDAPGRIDACAGLRIDGTWSRKATVRQRPHLSTIDAMVYGAWLAGLLVAHSRDLPPDAPFAVRSLSVRAGNEPVEEGLGAPLPLRRHRSGRLPHALDAHHRDRPRRAARGRRRAGARRRPAARGARPAGEAGERARHLARRTTAQHLRRHAAGLQRRAPAALVAARAPASRLRAL